MSTQLPTAEAEAHAHAMAARAASSAGVSRPSTGVALQKTPQARELELLGYEPWAMRLGRRTFKKPFAPFHHRFWRWYWPTTQKILSGEPLTPEELAALLVWGRGLGKSSHVEWACIAEGALAEGVIEEPGFVGYICADSDLAKGHVQSIRNRLDSPEIADYYPGLAHPRMDKYGRQVGYRQDYLVTDSGWGIVPIGLKEGVRGGRLFDQRFTMFVFDDVDNRKMSADVVRKNLEIIAYEILPAGTSRTKKLFPQNLVREDGCMAQMLSRETDVLSRRTVIGDEEGKPQPAFEEVELEPDEERPGSYRIKQAVPVWDGLDVAAAEVFLSDSGKAGFMAEFQNDLDSDRTEYVLQNWRDEVHVITRSLFAERYHTRAIPFYWGRRWFNDWAKTNTAKHANVAGCLSVSAQNTELPGCVFLSDCLTFGDSTEADEVALRILKTLSPTVTMNERVKTWDEIVKDAHSRADLSEYTTNLTDMIGMARDVRSRVIPPIVQRILLAQKLSDFRGSHEQNNNALKVYREVYGLPFRPCNPGSDGGIELLNSLMKVDRTQPHPFKADERDVDGLYKLGYTRFFLIVEDDQEAPPPKNANPRSLYDAQRARYQLKRWRELPVKDTETGEVERGPEKRNDDFGNGLMFCVHDGLPQAVPLTYGELLDEAIPADKRFDALKEQSALPGGGLTPELEATYLLNKRFAEQKITPRMQSFDEWGNPVGR